MTLQAQDLFTDTNGTVIASHAPDFDREAGGWTDHKDAASIQSNQYQYTDGANNFSLSTIDLGTTEQLIRLDGQIPDTGGTLEDVSIVIRFVDASNYWIVRATGDGQAEIVKVLAGVFTVEASQAVSAYIAGASVTLEARARNDTIQLIDIANSVNIVFDATDHNTATDAGVTLQSSVGGAGGGFIDNFKTYDMTPIGTLPMGGRLFIPRMISVPTVAQTIKSGGVSWDVSGAQLAHYLCNDNLPSTVILDASGSPVNNGVLNGTGPNTEDIFQASGKVDGALLFNGSNNFGNIDTVVGDAAANTKGSILAWIKPTASLQLGMILTFGDTDANELIQFRMNADGKLRAGVGVAGIEQWTIITDAAAVSAGVYTHVMIVQDGVSPVIYVNNVAVAITFTSDVDRSAWIAGSTGVDNARIGSANLDNLGEVSFLKSEIDDVRYINLAITAPQRAGIFNNGNGTAASSGIL